MLIQAPDDPKRVACQFDFDLGEVPDAEFYSPQISHRDGPTYSYDDLEAAGWTMELTLG